MMKLRKFLALALVACGGSSQTNSEVVSLPQQSSSASASSQAIIAQPSGREERDSPVPITNADAVWGKRDAPVTIVQFSDFQCPFCARGVDTIDQLEKDYGPQTLRIVWKNTPLPFHPNAHPAAEAAQAVRMLGGNARSGSSTTSRSTISRASAPRRTKLGAAIGRERVRRFATRCRLEALLREDRRGHRARQDHRRERHAGVLHQRRARSRARSRSTSSRPSSTADRRREGQDREGHARRTSSTSRCRRRTTRSPPPRTTTTTKTPRPSGRSRVGNAPQLGAKTALVTIVEFSDFQCPYCKRVEPTLKTIRDDLRRQGAPRLARTSRFRSTRAPSPPREVALEARAEKGDTGFWAAHDKLFDSQPKLDDADLEKVADRSEARRRQGEERDRRRTSTRARSTPTSDLGEDFRPPARRTSSSTVAASSARSRSRSSRRSSTRRSRRRRTLVSARARSPRTSTTSSRRTAKVPPPPRRRTRHRSRATLRRKARRTPRSSSYEFSDFQCPFCKRVEDALDEVMKSYGDKVKFVWRNYAAADAPGRAARRGSRDGGVQAEGQRRFLEDARRALRARRRPGRAQARDSRSYAQDARPRHGQVQGRARQPSHKPKSTPTRRPRKAAGVSGTPAFFIGTGNATGSAWTAYYITGMQPVAKLKKLVDLALGTHP